MIETNVSDNGVIEITREFIIARPDEHRNVPVYLTDRIVGSATWQTDCDNQEGECDIIRWFSESNSHGENYELDDGANPYNDLDTQLVIAAFYDVPQGRVTLL